jgi:mono/diheme cytochrome c family protein
MPMTAQTGSELPSARRILQALAAALLALGAATAGATDTYTPSTRQLTIPALTIGAATYTNVVVTVDSIVTLPSGSSPNGSVDTYDPGSGLLSVQSVLVGGTSYYNAVITVAGLVSIGSVSGADTFDGTYLKSPSIAVGGAHFANVTLTASEANVVRVNQGLPTAALDQYDPGTGHLTIAAIQVGGAVYTNVVVAASLGDIVAVGPAVSLAQVQKDIFNPYCAGCHNTGGPPPNLQSASTSGVTSINVASGEQPSIPYVKPGDPNGSYLVQKLLGLDSISGRQMPAGGPYLSPAQIEEVNSWILGL